MYMLQSFYPVIKFNREHSKLLYIFQVSTLFFYDKGNLGNGVYLVYKVVISSSL